MANVQQMQSCTKCKKSKPTCEYRLFANGRIGKRCQICRGYSIKTTPQDIEIRNAYNKTYYHDVLKPQLGGFYGRNRERIHAANLKHRAKKASAKSEAEQLASVEVIQC